MMVILAILDWEMQCRDKENNARMPEDRTCQEEACTDEIVCVPVRYLFSHEYAAGIVARRPGKQ